MSTDKNHMLATIHALRQLITDNELIIFMGEDTSVLQEPDKCPPYLDDWWKVVDFKDAKVGSQLPHIICTDSQLLVFKIQFSLTLGLTAGTDTGTDTRY